MPQKSFINETGRPQGHVQHGLQEYLTSNVMVYPDPFNFLAMKTAEYTEGGPGDPESADEGGTQMEYPSD